MNLSPITSRWRALPRNAKIAIGVGVAYLLLFAKRGSAMPLVAAGRVFVRPLAQGDPRWGAKFVGNSTKTYANIGCVTTAVTMAVNALKGTSLTPDMMQPGKMLTTSDYDGASIKSDQALARLGCIVRGRIRAVAHNAGGIAQMRNLLDDTLMKEGVAIVRVDYDTSTPEDNHSVVCFARDANGYHCADPAGGTMITLDANLECRRTSTKFYAATGVQPVFRS